jgi:hypothetical protein
MNIKPMLCFALILCVAGCTSVRTSTLNCTSLSREEQELIYSDLNRMLVNGGFRASSPSETPWGKAWDNDSFSSLWKGRAEFAVAASTNSTGMNIDVLYYRGGIDAEKALVNSVLACVQSNAPNAKVKIKTSTEIGPSFMGE